MSKQEKMIAFAADHGNVAVLATTGIKVRTLYSVTGGESFYQFEHVETWSQLRTILGY